MGEMEFAAIMPYITEDLASMISAKDSLSETEAVIELFRSNLYALLEQEDTKLWQYSTEMLYSLFGEEKNTGVITFPDV